MPSPVFVTITASDASSPAITVTVTPATNTPSSLFPMPAISGDTFQLGINPNTLNTLLAAGPAVYTATLTVSASGFAPLNIPVSLTISATSSIVASPASLTFTPTTSDLQLVVLTGSGAPNISFTYTVATSSGGSWLSVTSDNDFTPATLSVTVNPSIVTAGTYNGTITVTPSPSGGSLAIPISLQVGTNSLSVTPTSMSFAYTQTSTIPPPQVLDLSSLAPKDTFTVQATSSGNWLLVNGVTTAVTGSLPATLNVTVNPAGLAPGTYTGSILATDTNNNSQTVSVTLVISGISGVANPTSLLFLAQTGGAAPSTQTVSIQGFGAASYTATVQGSWLSISAKSGSAPAQITVAANPNGLAAGTYKGSIAINLSTHVQTIQATLVVSDDTVITTTPGDMIFAYAGGGAPGSGVTATQTLNVGSTGSAVTFSVASAVPSWMQVSPTGSLSTPQLMTVSITPQSLPTGIYLGQVVLTPSTPGDPAAIVPVLLSVTNNPAVTASVTSLAFTGSSGGVPQSQMFGVSAASALAFTATTTTTTGSGWLSVSPSSATTGIGSVPVTVTADPSGLTAGTYDGQVILTTSGGVVTTVAVTFTVGPNTTPFSISPTTMAFAYTQQGALPSPQTIQVTGGVAYTASATTTPSASWLSVTPTSGTGNGTLTVSVNPAALAAGTYAGTITVTPTGSTAQTVAVTLAVSPPATLTATPTPLAFAYVAGNPAPASQTLSVSSAGAAVTFTATASSSGWLSVTPTSGTTPAQLTVSVNPANLNQGTYAGTINLVDSSGALTFTVNVSLAVTTPLVTISRVVNAASYLGGGISPGEIAVLFGSAMGPAAGVTATIDSKGYIESSLANVKVTFNGYAAPLLYVSATQINTIVPYELAGSSNANVQVIFGGSRSNAITLPVVSSAPGIFSADESGQGNGAILDVNYHLVSSSNPVSVGSVIQIFATGQGQTNPAGIDGLIEPLSLPLPYPLGAPGVTIGGLPANIQYIGAAPGLVAGALQVNAFIPPGVAPGAAEVFISIGGNSSQSGITVAVQ
ncbi:MAG TPA: hypothetical protein VMI94_08675 [Bryobacteraceae bacterium]|nr:hypothetical protein [Bryobacteraceae bacterium]